uniref:Uncharacterized protein n=1 Tax=Leersia perrieri TaxID=77586 RepID=A0A0D9VD12_9ORYZ
METGASPPSPLSSLRDKLKATVCCCFGAGAGDTLAQWRRRVGAPGEFRYDPLSYALNFDEGADEEDDGGEEEDFDAGDHRADGLLYRSFSSRLAPSPTPATVAIA